MENVHKAIAWYQTKIGSYDKQLWEQSVERKLQKQPPFVLHNAPRKKVRHKTEYIDVDLIRGSTFTKTKPQVPWVYITRKAVARVLFFPFYYNWWVSQTSKKLYALLLVLYILQVLTVIVYLKNFDHSIMEDELCFTEVTLPTILMFLLCLIHSQTVLAHINHKPPKRNKNISGVTRKPHPKKTSRKGRSSGNNSTCLEDGGNTDTSRSSRRQTSNQPVVDVTQESNSLTTEADIATKKNMDPQNLPSIDMENNLLSRSVIDYDLKPAISSTLSEPLQQRCQAHHHHRHLIKNDVISDWNCDKDSSPRKQNEHHDKENICCVSNEFDDQKDNLAKVHRSGCNYNLLDNLSNLLADEKIWNDSNVQVDNENTKKSIKVKCCRKSSGIKLRNVHSLSEEFNNSDVSPSQSCIHINSENNRKTLVRGISQECIDINRPYEISNNVDMKDEKIDETNKDKDFDLDQSCSDAYDAVENTSFIQSARSQYHSARESAFECPSGSDNHSMSDFEMVDHHVVPEKHTSDQAVTPVDLVCSCTQNEMKNFELHNSAEARSKCSETQAKEIMVRFKPRPFKSQDSSDSGINNEVPFVDCSCVSLHKDNACDCTPSNKWHTSSSSGMEDIEDASLTSGAICEHMPECQHQTHPKPSNCGDISVLRDPNVITDSSFSQSDSYNPSTVKAKYLPQNSFPSNSKLNEKVSEINHQSAYINVSAQQSQPQISGNPSVLQNEYPTSARKVDSQASITNNVTPPVEDSSSQLHCFSELFVQEILNEDTLREMSCSSLLVHSDLENSSSSIGHLSTNSTTSSISNSSSCFRSYNTHHIPSSTNISSTQTQESSENHHHLHHHQQSLHKQENISHRHGNHEKAKNEDDVDDEKICPLDESLEHINASDGERPSDDVSNYNPSDSDADSDGPVNEDVCNRYEEKWKRLRFQEHAVGSDTAGKIITSKANTNIASSPTISKAGSGVSVNGGGSRSVVGILTRKPSPLKDLAIGRKSSSNMPVTNSSGSDQNINETRNQLRRRRRASGTPSEPIESNRIRNVPTTLGLLQSDTKSTHISSSENETGGARTPEGSNKATMSSEEWEDRMQSDETTSSAFSSNSDVDSEEKVEESERTEYTTSTLHVINLLQPQIGSPSSSGNITQPDRVSCVIWEGSECKKVDLTALDIGWAIIDKVDSLPESSDYFLIGLSFSFIICLMPLVFRAYASKDCTHFEEFLSWSGLMTKVFQLQKNYSWRQYLLMVNGILQRFFLSLIFFFLLSVADRTFKQRLLYAKHFSYLTSSRRARKFSMPHFRLNKVRNIKIWLSLRSYLKRRGPQRSVDVIVSACFLCAVCTVCLISLQMLKDTDSYLDYLCNWELLVWCTALGVFLMRFMTVGLKINKKYRNLSVLITEQINLYLQMEQKPHKKEELILANNVLRLAEDLLKELESPFKISGFSANPLIYNIMRVVVLSAFSAVLTEVLGFKLKLHKIKLKG